MKIIIYIIASILASYLVINHAFVTREQFYPAVIYLVTNKPSIVVLGNMAFVTVLFIAWIIKTIFLGTLKPTEVEVSFFYFFFFFKLNNSDNFVSLFCLFENKFLSLFVRCCIMLIFHSFFIFFFF